MITGAAFWAIVLSLSAIGLAVAVSLYRNRRAPELSDAVVIFLAGGGVSAGMKVCRIAVDPIQLTALDNERTYVFLAGLAVIWVSIDTIYKVLVKVGGQEFSAINSLAQAASLRSRRQDRLALSEAEATAGEE